MQCLLPQITRMCNVFEGVADLGDHLVFRYILPKHFCVDLVNKLLQFLSVKFHVFGIIICIALSQDFKTSNITYPIATLTIGPCGVSAIPCVLRWHFCHKLLETLKKEKVSM